MSSGSARAQQAAMQQQVAEMVKQKVVQVMAQQEQQARDRHQRFIFFISPDTTTTGHAPCAAASWKASRSRPPMPRLPAPLLAASTASDGGVGRIAHATAPRRTHPTPSTHNTVG